MNTTIINPLTETPTTAARIEITAAMVNEVRQMIMSDESIVNFVNNKVTDVHVKALHQVFMRNEKQDEKIAEAFNKSNIAGQNLESIAIARVSYNMPYYGELTFSTEAYYQDIAKLSLIKTLMNGFATLKYISKVSTIEKMYVEGKPTYKTEVVVSFDGVESVKNLTKGIYTEPGMLDGQYIHVKPGAKKLKLSSTQKIYLREQSSKAMRLAEISEDGLRAYYRQTKWYINAIAKEIEDPILLDERVERYIAIVIELQKEDRLYLTNWFDSRLRMYYTCSLLGVNPHGDTFETSMWEFADANIITAEGYEELVWAAVIVGIGRKPKAQALAYWAKNESKVREAMLEVKEPARSEKGEYIKGNFGEVFYNERMLKAIDDYRTNTPSRFMLGVDYTTGGLQHFGAAFKSVKSMKASNIGGLKIINDAHGIMGKTFGIEREAAKLINTPLLHGAGYKGIATRINDATGSDLNATDVAGFVAKAYGDEISNIQTIAGWGNVAYDNDNSTLLYHAFDGEKAQSTCYYESVKLSVDGLEFEGKKKYSTCTLHRDMPYTVSAKGEAIHDDPKTMGLYANITHTIDGWTLRQIDAQLYKHDKFYCRPGNMESIRETGRNSAVYAMKHNGYVSAITDIANSHRGATAIPRPELVFGKGTEQMIKDSNNFIVA